MLLNRLEKDEIVNGYNGYVWTSDFFPNFFNLVFNIFSI